MSISSGLCFTSAQLLHLAADVSWMRILHINIVFHFGPQAPTDWLFPSIPWPNSILNCSDRDVTLGWAGGWWNGQCLTYFKSWFVNSLELRSQYIKCVFLHCLLTWPSESIVQWFVKESEVWQSLGLWSPRSDRSNSFCFFFNKTCLNRNISLRENHLPSNWNKFLGQYFMDPQRCHGHL